MTIASYVYGPILVQEMIFGPTVQKYISIATLMYIPLLLGDLELLLPVCGSIVVVGSVVSIGAISAQTTSG